MKTSKIILAALCAAAALASCDKNDPKEALTAPHPMTITLDREDASDTKTTITQDGSNWKRVWADGDAVSVIYYVGDVAKNEKFTLVSGAGTTKATFTCAASEIPTTGDQSVRIFYPYTDTKNSFGWWVVDLSNQTGKLENLGNYDINYQHNAKFSDGTLTTGKSLSPLSVFFRIPSGTKIFSTSDASQSNTGSISLADPSNSNLSKEFLVHSTSIKSNSTNGPVTVSSVSLTGGCLTEDVYIAAYITSSWNNPTLRITFNCTENSKTYTYDVSKPATFIRKNFTLSAPATSPLLWNISRLRPREPQSLSS